jgi:hypothetical protein
MLATQDVQASDASQLAFEERSDDGAEVAEELRQVLHESDLLQLRAAGLAARFAATKYYDEQGYATPIDWIRFNCHLTTNAAADLIAVGKNLQRMPESAQAVSQGEIGYAHAKAMARTANAVGAKFAEAPLLEKARENSAGKFYYICNHYRHAADRRGFEAEQAELVENRRLWISKCDDGTVLLNGSFDAEGGAALITAYEPLARKSGAHDDRSREKRLADAAVDLAMHAMDMGLIPQQGSQRTHLQVTTSLETLQGLPGASAADLEFSSVPISAKTVERLACDASITRMGARFGVDSDRRWAGEANDLRTGAQGAQRARSRLHLAGLRAAGELDFRPPYPALDTRRVESTAQPHPSLLPASLDGA